MERKYIERRVPIKILFVNGTASLNKGSVAIVKSAKEALEKYIPQSQFGVLVTPSANPSKYKASGLEIEHISSKRGAPIRYVITRQRLALASIALTSATLPRYNPRERE